MNHPLVVNGLYIILIIAVVVLSVLLIHATVEIERLERELKNQPEEEDCRDYESSSS